MADPFLNKIILFTYISKKSKLFVQREIFASGSNFFYLKQLKCYFKCNA